jgi:proteasome lid subunit RPN8/RPN11
VLREIEAHAREEQPRECCGMLIGVEGRVDESRRSANLSDDPHRFLLDPHVHIAALRDTRSRQLQVVGFYHSHPRSRPVPSPTDLAESTYPEALHLIIGRGEVARGVHWEARAYYLHGTHFVEVPLQVENGSTLRV